MGWGTTLYDRIEDVPHADWSRLAPDPANLAMDPRLLGTFQSTMRDQCRCWFVIVRDDGVQAVGSACLCLFRIDALETTGAATRFITRNIRRLFPGYMRFNVGKMVMSWAGPSASRAVASATTFTSGWIISATPKRMSTSTSTSWTWIAPSVAAARMCTWGRPAMISNRDWDAPPSH